jgi:dolichol-phosphate mannosyltransferase
VTSQTALVVVPTYNERENLPILARALMAYPTVRLLVVDDNSPDGTGDVAEALARDYPGRVAVMHRTTDRGLGRSYVDGLRRALGEPVEVICQMDADLSHDPADLPRLIAASASADLVIGSRYTPGGRIVNWPLTRRLLSRLANLYIRRITRLHVLDCTGGYRCWRREALAMLPLDRTFPEGYAFLVEMLYLAAWKGKRIAEVPITFVERRHGQSKLSWPVLLESIWTPWRLAATVRMR